MADSAEEPTAEVVGPLDDGDDDARREERDKAKQIPARDVGVDVDRPKDDMATDVVKQSAKGGDADSSSAVSHSSSEMLLTDENADETAKTKSGNNKVDEDDDERSVKTESSPSHVSEKTSANSTQDGKQSDRLENKEALSEESVAITIEVTPMKSMLLDMEPVSSDDDNLDMAEDVERRRKNEDKKVGKVKEETSTIEQKDAIREITNEETKGQPTVESSPEIEVHENALTEQEVSEEEDADASTSEKAHDKQIASKGKIESTSVKSELKDTGAIEEKETESCEKKGSDEDKKESGDSERTENVAVVKNDREDAVGVSDESQVTEDEKFKTADDSRLNDDKDVNDVEMSTLEILDVRTVSDEEKSASSSEKADEQDIDKDDEDKTKDDVESKSGEDKFKGSTTKKDKKRKTNTNNDAADMKNFAADAMNELLGLFGYDKVDDKVKESLLVDSKVKEEEKENDAVDEANQKAQEGVVEPAATQNATSSGESTDKSVVTATKPSTPVVGRQCSVCGKTKACKYQVLMLGMTKFLCDDFCFKEFRTKQKISMASAATTASVKELAALSQDTTPNRPVTRSITHPKDVCNQCSKEIRNGQGLLPGVGENKPLCSEECMRAYQATQGLKRACAQCGGHILGRSRCLTWEAMEYCNEECLGKYQSYLGSHCAFCQQGVQQTSLGKYCVRFGSDIKQFCSNGCLEEFKKGLKICSYCQKDISTGSEGFLAPVGDKGQFKEFCSQSCMEKFETMGNPTPIRPSIQQCSVCSKVTSVKVEVTFEGKVHRLCSEPCIAAFRYANKINTSICDTCHKFFDLDVTRQLSIQFEGTCKRFCTKACTNVFVLHHRKVVPCSWCKVKKYNFDMIERVDSNNQVQLFCSLNCLSLFRVSLNATSSRRVQCDYCHQSKPAQYHLTMSDASIRNFCSYRCVMQFQSQFTTVTPAPLTPPVTLTTSDTTSLSSPTQSSTINADGSLDAIADGQTCAADQTGTPIISSVMSLAPSQTISQLNTVNRSIVLKTTTASGLTHSTDAVATKCVKTAQTQTLYPAISQHVIIKQPPVKMQKNKTISCKPMVQTKGVSCKPHPCHKSVQTEENREKQLFVPVPVPIYVPVPMHMYTSPVPFPIAFPVPIPVPIFIPTTKNSAQGIFRQIKEIQEKIPDNPFEADLILMAEMVAEDGSAVPANKEKSIRRTRGAGSNSGGGGSAGSITQSGLAADADADVSREAFEEDVESQLRDSCQTSNSFGEDVLQMALQMASGMDGEPVDLETALTTSSNGGNESNSRDSVAATDENGSSFLASKSDIKSSSRSGGQKRSRGGGVSARGVRGRKRARFEADAAREGSPTHDAERSANLPHPPPPYSYGVNAWKHWVLQKNSQLERAGSGATAAIVKGSAGQGQRTRRLKLFKTDLLQLTADELNYSLCLFVKEVRKPDGGEYAADSVYYLCLGIQQYLFESGRVDNIFADAYYEKFTECLNDVLISYEMALVSQGVFLSRIEEEILWDCKQLGAHSPHVLLNTLMYFNTKYFMLKTVDDHTQLSFSHILKHWKKGPGGGSSSSSSTAAAATTTTTTTTKGHGGTAGSPGRSALLRYYPPSQMKDTSRRRKDSVPSYEQVENLDNPLRCPVKLYEFYLSKCPESIKNRSDVFYLYPERSCVPDSPVWYSTMSLGKETITKMLQRIKMVREVGETMMMLS